MMKKTTFKLVVHRETLRVLTKLDLVRVAGGNPDAQLMDTEGPATGCQVVPAGVDTSGVGGCVNRKA